MWKTGTGITRQASPTRQGLITSPLDSHSVVVAALKASAFVGRWDLHDKVAAVGEIVAAAVKLAQM